MPGDADIMRNYARGLQGRGNRKDVQISEKEVVWNVHEKSRDEGVSKTFRAFMLRGGDSHGTNQAATESEHIVVVGSQRGKYIEKVVVRSEENLANDLNVVSGGALFPSEHHKDPPNGGRKDGDDPQIMAYPNNKNFSGDVAPNEGNSLSDEIGGSSEPDFC